MEKLTYYKGDIGRTISLVLSEDGSPIDLTSGTVTLYLYAVGSNNAIWNHECTIDNASNGLAHYDTVDGDLDTVGVYWTRVNITYSGGDVTNVTGMAIEVLDTISPENLVSTSEFLNFLDIASDNAKSDNKIKDYLEQAESQLYLDIPSIRDSTSEHYIKLKKMLIKKSAGITYFMNSDEGEIDPNSRNQKIELWREDYNRAVENLGNVISSDPEAGTAIMRRVKSSDYSDPNSYLYGTDD